jgi:hypothetical protein
LLGDGSAIYFHLTLNNEHRQQGVESGNNVAWGNLAPHQHLPRPHDDHDRHGRTTTEKSTDENKKYRASPWGYF